MSNIKRHLNQIAIMLILLLFVDSVFAAIVYKSSTSANGRPLAQLSSGTAVSASSGNVTPSLPTGYAKDDLFVCLVESYDNVVPTISSPSGWTRLYSNSNTSVSQASLFYKFATSSSETNPVITHSSGSTIIARCSTFSGVDTTTPFDTPFSSAASSYGYTNQTGSLSTVTAKSLLLYVSHIAASDSSLTVGSTGGLTWVSSYIASTSSGGGGATISLKYAVKASTGSIGPISGTFSSNPGVSNGVLIALRPKALSLTINVPSGTAAGDVMIAAIAVSPNTPTISTPTGWTLVRTLSQTSTTTSRLAIFRRVATASEPSSYSWTLSTTFTGTVGGITTFSGVDNTTPISVENGQITSSSTTQTTPSITTTFSSSMLVGIFSYASAGTWTPPTGMTEVVDIASRTPNNASGESLEMVYLLQSSAGSTGTKSAKASTSSDRGATELLALKPAGAVVGIDHIQIEHDGSGVICAPEVIVIKACSNASCSTLYSGSTTVTLSPAATSAISWTTNPITFTGSTSVNLSVTSQQTVTLGTSAASPTPFNSTICYAGTSQSCSLPFASSGFVFSTVPTQIAGTNSASISIQAITGSSGGVCSGLTSGSKAIDLAFQCIDPNTCAGKQVSVNSTAISSNPASSISAYTATNLTFDSSSKATFTINYPDVGKISLAARYSLGGGNYMLGNSNTFIVKPSGFSFSNIKRTSDSFANPAASSASGAIFSGAGNDFSATLSAISSTGSVTPNFGNESKPEGILLDYNLVSPTIASGGDSGVLSGTLSIDGTNFTNGISTVTDLNWNEVGVISLSASIQDSDYLGAGDITTTSGNIGRFTPDHFATNVTSACSTATPFTYSGQHADITITALDANGNVTGNYDNTLGYAKTITLSNAGTTTGFTLNTMLSGFTGGVGTDTDVVYTFPTVMTPPTTLIIRAVDSDSVSSNFPSDPTTEDTDLIHSGRLSLANAAGSELLPLTVPLQAQYWSGNAFVIDTDDSCTQINVPTTGNGLTYTGSITASNTAPSINGVSSGSVALVSGAGDLLFPAPSNKLTGYIDISVIADSVPWLKFNWKGTGNINPTARANFGLFQGDKKIIYMQEVY